MDNNAEITLALDDQPKPRFWIDKGVYYAQVPLPAGTGPFTITLHGVSNDHQAAEALEFFTPKIPCAIPLPA